MQDTVLRIARPQGLSPFEVDLTMAYAAEGKLQEIPTAHNGNALHLIGAFARAYNALSKAYAQLYHEVGVATVKSRKRRAHLVLDVVPATLKEKGLSTSRSPSGSEDMREAICYSDEEYCAIEEYRAAIEAAKELVFIKLQTFRMALTSVQAILRGTSSTTITGGHDMSTNVEGPDPMTRAWTETEQFINRVDPPPIQTKSATPRRGFGRVE